MTEHPNSFIKDHSLLEERSDVIDSFGFGDYINNLSSKLDKINTPSVIAIIGRYGIGKSTMLHNLKLKRKNTSHLREHWFEFDAWKYPNKKDLWEGFVLDFAESIGKKKQTKNKIEDINPKRFIASALLAILTTMLPFISDFVITNKIPTIIQLLLFIQISLLAGFIFYKCFYFIEKKPATKISDLQDILKNSINRTKKNIIIVVEDIDRAKNEEGVFFLETLSNFIKKELNHRKNTIIIVPIAKENYTPIHETENKYEKAIDYIEHFNITPKNIENYLTQIIKKEYLFVYSNNQILPCAPLLSRFFIHIFNTEKRMSIRIFKKILKNADKNYLAISKMKHKPIIPKITQDYFIKRENSIDYRICLCIETSKFFYTSPTQNHKTFKESFIEQKFIPQQTIYSSFIESILYESDQLYRNTGLRNDTQLKGSLIRIIDSNTFSVKKNDQSSQHELSSYYLI